MSKVLLVEDDQAQCELLEEVFTDEGFQVQVAHTGQQALAILKREGGWVVWLDLLLPGMNGLEVMRALRDAPSLLDANKVILTSASWSKEVEAQRDRSEGVVATLRKPFNLDEALTLLRRVAG